MTAKHYAEIDAQGHQLVMYRNSGTYGDYLAVTADNLAIGGEHASVWLTLYAAQMLDAALAEGEPFEFTDHSGDRMAVAPDDIWTTFEITRAERENDDEPSATVRVVLLSARVPQLRRSLAGLLEREAPTSELLSQTREAVRSALVKTTGEQRPMWRAVRTFNDAPTGVAPVCTSERGDALHATHSYRFGESMRDEQGVYHCCPLPIIESDSAVMAAYLVELLNADAEDRHAKVLAEGIPPLWIAEYEGVEPTLHLTSEAAIAACDDIVKVDAHGQGWDWRTEDGVERQFWTHPDDDRPTGYTSGAVWQIAVKEYAEPQSYPPALPWAKQMDADDLEGFLADLADAASGDDDLTTLAEVESAIARWRVIGEAQHAHNTAPGPDAVGGAE